MSSERPIKAHVRERIGVTLPVEYASGVGTSTDTEHLRAAFGPREALLEVLANEGVGSVEVKSRWSTTPAEAIRDAFRSLWDTGFEATLHGQLPANGLDENEGDSLSSYRLLFEETRRAGRVLLIVVHAHCFGEYSRAENGARTAADLRRLCDWDRGRGENLRFALEIGRDHGRPDPCYTYDGVLQIIGELDPNRVGVCFDFGHVFWNTEHVGLASAPSLPFLRRTIHTHVHAVGPEGPHYPLGEGRIPLEAYVGALEEHGYRGVYNLELGCYRFARPGNVVEGYVRSIRTLRRVLARRADRVGSSSGQQWKEHPNG